MYGLSTAASPWRGTKKVHFSQIAEDCFLLLSAEWSRAAEMKERVMREKWQRESGVAARGLIVPVKNAQWVPFCPSWPCLCLQPRGCWATEMSLQISKALPKEKGGCSRNNHHSNYYSVAGSLISTTGYLKGVSSANLRAETYKTEFSRGVKS